MEQRVLILEVEARPDKAGMIYASAADAESRINEALSQGWSIKQIHNGGQHSQAAIIIIELYKEST